MAFSRLTEVYMTCRTSRTSILAAITQIFLTQKKKTRAIFSASACARYALSEEHPEVKKTEKDTLLN
jgi:hypothetical protein